jgi:hypothetical protein
VRTTVTALLVVLGFGCADRDLDWNIEFESTALEAQAMRLDARILRGACPGTEVIWDEIVYPERPPEPPSLPPGTYCFGARAGNASCEWFATGETTLELPTDEMVTIVLAMEALESNCSATCNADGTCDENPDDCTEGGCTQICTSDCTASCSGGSCTQVCRGVADCNFSCVAGSCSVVCEDAASCNATCTGGSCGMTCSGAATDCVFDCVGGACTFTCDDPDNCMRTCLPMDCSGP